jgi:hypothetical protein
VSHRDLHRRSGGRRRGPSNAFLDPKRDIREMAKVVDGSLYRKVAGPDLREVLGH